MLKPCLPPQAADACREDQALAPQLLPWLLPEIKRLCSTEHALRMAVWAGGVHGSRRATEDEPIIDEEEVPECRTCRAPLLLSAVQCDCSDEVAVCLYCADTLCGCEKSRYQAAVGLRVSLCERVACSGAWMWCGAGSDDFSSNLSWSLLLLFLFFFQKQTLCYALVDAKIPPSILMIIFWQSSNAAQAHNGLP